jgi:hypothetical protein
MLVVLEVHTFALILTLYNLFFRNDLVRRSPVARDVSSSDSDRDNTSEEKASGNVRKDLISFIFSASRFNIRHVFAHYCGLKK